MTMKAMCIQLMILSMMAVQAAACLDMKALEHVLQVKRKQFDGRYAAEDHERLAELYTPDTVVMPFQHNSFIGRKHMADFAAHMHSQGLRRVRMEMVEVLPLTQGDCIAEPAETSEYAYVVERGVYHLFGEDGEEKQAGDYMVVWKVDEFGDALIHWDIFNDRF